MKRCLLGFLLAIAAAIGRIGHAAAAQSGDLLLLSSTGNKQTAGVSPNRTHNDLFRFGVSIIASCANLLLLPAAVGQVPVWW